MRNELMKDGRRRLPLALVAASGAVILLAGVAWVGASVASANTLARVSEDYAVLEMPQGRGDKLEESFPFADHGHGGLLPDSSRLIGVAGPAKFYLAEDSVHNLCLLLVDTVALYTSSSCVAPELVEGEPIALKTTYLSDSVEAFLIPDDAVGSFGGRWQRIGKNLVVVAPENAGEDSLRITYDGRTLELRRFAEQSADREQDHVSG